MDCATCNTKCWYHKHVNTYLCPECDSELIKELSQELYRQVLRDINRKEEVNEYNTRR